MKFGITGDYNWESKVDKVLRSLSETHYREHFASKNYGTSINEIFVVLMCRDREYNFKQRVKFSKKKKILDLDIMLDSIQFAEIKQSERNKIVVDKLMQEIPPIIDKYKFEDFDLKKFELDLAKCMKKVDGYYP